MKIQNILSNSNLKTKFQNFTSQIAPFQKDSVSFASSKTSENAQLIKRYTTDKNGNPDPYLEKKFAGFFTMNNMMYKLTLDSKTAAKKAFTTTIACFELSKIQDGEYDYKNMAANNSLAGSAANLALIPLGHTRKPYTNEEIVNMLQACREEGGVIAKGIAKMMIDASYNSTIKIENPREYARVCREWTIKSKLDAKSTTNLLTSFIKRGYSADEINAQMEKLC